MAERGWDTAGSEVDGPDPWTRVRAGLIGVGVVGVASSVAYRVLGLGWLDAVYQTVITMSTVGYREIGSGQEADAAYKLVTIVVVLAGTMTLLYTVGMLVEAVLEERLSDRVRRRRMDREISQLSGHVIVCGWGQVGQSITESLAIEGTSVVVVDRRDVAADAGLVRLVCGDATDDDVLRQAGVERARALVVALDTDAENVYVTLSGRRANPDLFIIARANHSSSESKMLQAGADRAVNPHEIGGSRMAALVTHPNVTDFLGVVMYDQDTRLRLVEMELADGDTLCGRTSSECGLDQHAVLLVAIRQPSGEFTDRPSASACFEHGQTLILLGTDEQIADFRTQFRIVADRR